MRIAALRQIFAIVLALLCWSMALAQGDLKIGFVNAARILDQAPQAEQARERLEKEFAPRDQELVSAQRTLRQLEEKLASDNTSMADEERRQMVREINSQKREIKRLRAEFQEDFNIRRNEELAKLQRQVYEAIVSLAKEEGFDLIVNDGAVIYASDRVDITDKVLERLQ